MESNFAITCAIPRAGRTFENFLVQLKNFGVDSREINKILEISGRSKALSSPDYQEASRFLHYAVQEVPCFGLYVDRKRQNRPYRVGFLAREWVIQGQRVRVQ